MPPVGTEPAPVRPQLGTATQVPPQSSQRTGEVVVGPVGFAGSGAAPDCVHMHPGVPGMQAWQEIRHSKPDPVPPHSALPLQP